MRISVMTPLKRSILKYMEEYYEENGYPPSIREICDAVGQPSTSVVRYSMGMLIKSGHLAEGIPGAARTIIPTFKGRPRDERVR